MNVIQQQTIQSLRQSGYSFSQIAAQVGLSKSTVKSFCYRQHTDSVSTVPVSKVATCPQCGKPIPTSTHKQRRFCSDTCRAQYWTTHPDEISRKSAIESVCPVCHHLFTDYAQRKRKYCSHACYIANRYYGGKRDDT